MDSQAKNSVCTDQRIFEGPAPFILCVLTRPQNYSRWGFCFHDFFFFAFVSLIHLSSTCVCERMYYPCVYVCMNVCVFCMCPLYTVCLLIMCKKIPSSAL